MSLARKHREKVLASLSIAVAPALASGLATDPNPGPVERMAAQIALRLRHDRKRLHEIQSVEAKVAAKREMLPEYESWISGLVETGTAMRLGSADPVLPTVMVWKIDTGDFAGALVLAAYVLEHNIKLPDQFKRQAATLIVEDIAEAALKLLLAGNAFDLTTLETVGSLTVDHDMPDEVRAKLFKALGLELARRAEGQEIALTARRLLERALPMLKRAHELHDRSGVKDRIKKVEKALAALPTNDTAGDAG
jgi:hypothetical protein